MNVIDHRTHMPHGLNPHAERCLLALQAAARDSLLGWVSGEYLAQESVGSNRYSARLDELRKLGAVIERRHSTGKWSMYRLTNWRGTQPTRRRFDLSTEDLYALAGGTLPASVIRAAQAALGLDRQPELFTTAPEKP